MRTSGLRNAFLGKVERFRKSDDYERSREKKIHERKIGWRSYGKKSDWKRTHARKNDWRKDVFVVADCF